jgi:hypothetical protein
LDYKVLAFVDNDEYYLNENTTPVILHNGDWFELRYSEHSKTPYLGVQRDDIHTYDIPTSEEESTSSSGDEDSSNGTDTSSNDDKETNPRGEGPSKRKHKKKKDKGKGKAKEKTPSSDDQEIRNTPISPEITSRSRSQEGQLLTMTPISTPSEVFTPEMEAAPKSVTMRPPPPTIIMQTPRMPRTRTMTLGDPGSLEKLKERVLQTADQNLSWDEIDAQALRATQNYRSNLHDIPEGAQIKYGSQPSTDPSDDSSSDDEIPEPNPRAPPRPNNR